MKARKKASKEASKKASMKVSKNARRNNTMMRAKRKQELMQRKKAKCKKESK